ncbi:hypothetical protein RRSWK_04558 [Rhodopirellula sp. SWK7]|nr:hypothetical protein RRSWK_04558 [Rhodopirellula sp. SWK7]
MLVRGALTVSENVEAILQRVRIHFVAFLLDRCLLRERDATIAGT